MSAQSGKASACLVCPVAGCAHESDQESLTLEDLASTNNLSVSVLRLSCYSTDQTAEDLTTIN